MSSLHRTIDIPLLETRNPRYVRERRIIGTCLLLLGSCAVGALVYFASMTNDNDSDCIKWGVTAAGAIALYVILVVMYFIWPFKSNSFRGDAKDCLLYLGIVTYAMSIAATFMPCKHNIYLDYAVTTWCAICTLFTCWGLGFCICKLLRSSRPRFDTSQNQEIEPELLTSSTCSETNDV